MQDLDKLLQDLRNDTSFESQNAKMDEIAALGEGIIPELAEMMRMRQESFIFAIPMILAKIGRVSSPVLLEFFISEFVEFNLFQSIASAMAILKDKDFFEPLLPFLHSDDEKRAKAAVRILGRLNDDRLIAPMTAILQDNTSKLEHKSRAIESLGLSPIAKQCIPLIQQYLSDSTLSHQALLALYRLDAELGLEQIQKFFHDASEDLLSAFLYTVADKKDKRLSPLLVELLNTSIKTFEILASKSDFRGLPYGLFRAIAELKIENAIDSLMLCVDIQRLSPESAIETIAKIGSDYALERLIGKLGYGFEWWDEWSHGHGCLVENIASFGSAIFEPLTKIILNRTESLFRRSYAAEVLCHLAGSEVVEFFLALCEKPDAIVLCESDPAYNLYRLKDKRIVEPVLKLIRSGQMSSQYAANALALADTEDLIPLLKSLYKRWRKEKDEAKKKELLFLLAGAKDERMLPELKARLYLQEREPYPDAATHAARLLMSYTSEKAAKILQSRLLEIPRDSVEWLRFIQEIIEQWAKQGKDSLELLLELLNAPSLQVRMVAISKLQLVWDRERVLAALMPLLHDKNRIPNANTRICDEVAIKLRVYDIKEAQEVFNEWQTLDKSGFFFKK